MIRKLAPTLILALVTTAAVAQQWHVVQSVALSQQTQAIGSTVLYTPTQQGFYRMTIYFSGGSGSVSGGYWALAYHGLDVTGQPLTGDVAGMCGNERFTSTSAAISLMPNQPFTYEVDAGGTPSFGCTYNVAITVEQLQ